MEDLKYLRTFWFNNPTIWFGCGTDIDIEITNKFGHLLQREQLELTPGQGLEHVLLWDQIVRHVYRNNTEIINKYHQKALALSLQLLDEKYDHSLKANERCFLLMPLRHTFDIPYLNIVIEKIKGYMKTDGLKPYQRFYKSTLLSYSKLITQKLDEEIIDPNIGTDSISSVLDENSTRSIAGHANLHVYRQDIYKLIKRFLRNNPSDGITLSISGGVDSMVCSYILYHIRLKFSLKIRAVMVNYNNRPDCLLETQMVIRWLKSLNIPLYIRHVKHLRRGNVDRGFYEKVTKQFRFDMYRRFGYPVILGHNKDDCVENIFTNIRKGRNYNNLNGMEPVSLIDDVIFYRPILSVPKSEIYEFAKEFGIPYLTDSTPEWSDRGKIRDTLVPFLNKFDPALIPGLLKLSHNISDLYSSQNMLVQQFKTKIKITQSDAVIVLEKTSPERRLGLDFWKQVIRYITSCLGVDMCSNRSIYSLLKVIIQPSFAHINLSKHLKVSHNYNVIIFSSY